MVEKMLETMLSIQSALHLTHNKSPKSLQPPTRPFKICSTSPCLYSRTLGPHATSFPGHSAPTTVASLLALEQSGIFQFLHTYDSFCWSVLPHIEIISSLLSNLKTASLNSLLLFSDLFFSIKVLFTHFFVYLLQCDSELHENKAFLYFLHCYIPLCLD